MQSDLASLVVIWLLTFALITSYSWRYKDRTVGGTLAFVVFLSMIHLFQAVIYLFPWYEPFFDPQILQKGFGQALIGLISFTLGALLIYPALHNFHTKYKKLNFVSPVSRPFFPIKLHFIYIILGVFNYFILGTILSGIPSAQAFVSNAVSLWQVGSMVWLWEIFHKRADRTQLWPIIGLSLLWPILTVVRDGFLGFGIVPVIFILIFAALQMRRVWKLIIPILLISYFILSFGTVYFESRNTIRGIIWYNVKSTNPIEDIFNIFGNNYHWFDITDGKQLTWIDNRLGYNYPTGLVVERINQGIVPPSNGRTIEDAVLMVVPRILWPDKPIAVGGGTLFEYFTGIPISRGTSVGLSPVLEFYANYQTTGVIVGFLLLGIIIATLDHGAKQALQRSDYMSFAVWMLPIFGLALVQDTLFTIVGATVSGAVTAVLVNFSIRIVFSVRNKSLDSSNVHANQ